MAARGPGRGYQASDAWSLRQQKTLSEYPTEMVTYECGREGCERHARFRKDRLIAEHGPDIGLVNLLNALKPKDCPLNKADWQKHNHCRMRYGPELLASANLGPLFDP